MTFNINDLLTLLSDVPVWAYLSAWCVLTWHWFLVARGSWHAWKYPGLIPHRLLWSVLLLLPLAGPVLPELRAALQGDYSLVYSATWLLSVLLLLGAFSLGHGSYMNPNRVRGHPQWFRADGSERTDNESLRHLVGPLAAVLGQKDGTSGYNIVGSSVRGLTYGLALLPLVPLVGWQVLIFVIGSMFWYPFQLLDRKVNGLDPYKYSKGVPWFGQESLYGAWLMLLMLAVYLY